MQPCVAVAVVWGEGGGTDRLQALDDLLHVHELAVVGLKGELDLQACWWQSGERDPVC